jgi:hypothetical protein
VNVFTRLSIPRYAPCSIHGARACVIRGQSPVEIAIIPLQEGMKIANSAVEILLGVKRVVYAQLLRGSRN